jgi:cellulose synthase/poly-beta-1,6-N-acetylglucosamine synthase-like glycosyltransferase
LTSNDVTVVIPSIEGAGEELGDTIRSILATEPYEIILVTIEAHELRAKLMLKSMGTSKVRVFAVAHPNKRRQMVRAIPEVQTEITVFADDDVTWPAKLLPWMLAPLEDERYGGVGTNQRLRRAENPDFPQRVWGYLGALYLERRNFDCAACMYMDGGLPCLSGRTVAYRTRILRDEAFIHGFTHEEWLGRYQLNADDDNFITRWLVSHGKGIWYQYHKEAEVQTTLEDNSKFLKQCLRWSRSNWRSNITSMFCERHIWRSVDWARPPGGHARLWLCAFANAKRPSQKPPLEHLCGSPDHSLPLGTARRFPADLSLLPSDSIMGR